MKEKLVPSFPGYSSHVSLIIWALSLLLLVLTIILGIFSYKTYLNSGGFFISTTQTMYPVELIDREIHIMKPLCITDGCLTLLVGIIIICSAFLFLFLLLGKIIIKQSNSIGSFFTNKTILFLLGFLFTIGEFLMNLCKPKEPKEEEEEEDKTVDADKTVYIFGIIFSGLSFLSFFFTHYSINPGNNKVIKFLIKKVFLAPIICFHLYYLFYSTGKLLVENDLDVISEVLQLKDLQAKINNVQLLLIIAFIVFLGVIIFLLKDFIVGIIGILLFIGMITKSRKIEENIPTEGPFATLLKTYLEKAQAFTTITQATAIIGIIIICAEIILMIFVFKFKML